CLESAAKTNFNFGQGNLFASEAALPAFSPSPIQAKLTIGQPNDRYEQEADNVAKTVVQQINNPSINQQEHEVQRAPLAINAIRRLPLQRQGSIPVGTASDEFENNLNRARSGGSSLAPKVKSQMESAMGADFSRVRIHTDAQSNQLSQSIQAKAFTTGQDVFFKQGEYNPSSRSGQELIAHELTHVVQQNSNTIQRFGLAEASKQIVSGQQPQSSLNNSSSQTQEPLSPEEVDAPVEQKTSILKKGTVLERGQGVIAAVCDEDKGRMGGHSWVTFEALTPGGEVKNVVMDLIAKGGKGDSQSGGSGGSGGSVGSDHHNVSTTGSVASGTHSNDQDTGSIVQSGGFNVGSAELETFGGSITIRISEQSPDYVRRMAQKVTRTWDITSQQATQALAQGHTMQQKANQGKYLYAISGRSISLTKKGMNCARFVEEVLNAAGVRASAGLFIKTPSEIATGKKFGIKQKNKKSGGGSGSNGSKSSG
ncbi:MAG: DUF4157 domain-containing protein, partial [Leptolyngbya sp. SIO3F4]|nr:DUF4157 domain-containing protein [Leptolyngbya sp. SIO3F4]